MDKKVGMELGNVADSNITPEIDEEKIQTMFGEQEELLKFLSEFRVDEELFAKVVLERDALKFLFREYKELEEQGLLLRLPCKVGDTVWCVDVDEDDYSGMIFMGICGDYVIGCSTYAHLEDAFDAQIAEMALESKENYGVEVYIYHKDDVFLTREEAEAKLKEMR